METTEQARRCGRDSGFSLAGRPVAARCLLLSLAGLLFVTVPAAGQILDDAWRGREQAASFFHDSIEKERAPPDWAGSIEALKKSVELSPDPSWEASLEDGSGRWRRHYVPYYYLGLAYWGQGDCPQAVESLATSLARGEVCKCKQGERRNLEKVLLKCEQRGVAPEQPARDLVRSECSKVVATVPPAAAAPEFERLAAEPSWGTALDLFPEIGLR